MNKPLIGIIGGMGPLSSAVFLNDCYMKCLGKFETEQEYPRIILVSDPSLPDRTSLYQNKKYDVFSKLIGYEIKKLEHFNIDKIILCCFTAHAFFPFMDSSLRNRLTSLVDILSEKINFLEKKSLLISSRLTTTSRLIENENLIYLDEGDCELVNQFIFFIKTNAIGRDLDYFIELLEKFSKKYNVDTVVFGCTELHFIYEYVVNKKLFLSYKIIDLIDVLSNYVIDISAS